MQSVSGGVAAKGVSAPHRCRQRQRRRDRCRTSQCDRVEAHSVSGNVEFGGTLAKGGRYELNSHSGDVRVVLAGATGFELEANSFSGTIHSDLPLKSPGRSTIRTAPPIVHGVFGDGSAVLSVTTFSGNVVISRR